MFSTVSLDASAAAVNGPDSFLKPGISCTNSEREENQTVLLSILAEDLARSSKEDAKLRALSLATERVSACFNNAFD